MTVSDRVLPLLFEVALHPAAKRGVKLRQIANLHGACTVACLFNCRQRKRCLEGSRFCVLLSPTDWSEETGVLHPASPVGRRLPGTTHGASWPCNIALVETPSEVAIS